MPSSLSTRLIASLILFSSTFVVTPLATLAGPITVPSGLSHGEQYRLVFVTSTTTTATLSDIGYYNPFVASVANSAPQLALLGTTWSAIASTPTVAAQDNTNTTPDNGSGLPIYNPKGELFAASNQALWGTTNSNVLPNPIDWNESDGLNFPNDSTWTGTTDQGNPAGFLLGSFSGFALTGLDSANGVGWIDALANDMQTLLHSVYALSGVLTVPVPELSSMFLHISQRLD
jgi:hypothetical protein